MSSSGKSKKKNSILKSIVNAFWSELLQVLLLSTAEIILRISEIVCLGFLLVYFQPHSTMTALDAEYWSIGMLVAIGLRIFVNSLQRSHTLDTSTKIKVACSNLVYRKALRLKTQTLQENGCNEMTTLIARDLDGYDSKIEFIHYVYSAPDVLIAVGFVMYEEYGLPGLVGTVFILLVAIIQAFLAGYISKLKILQDKFACERMRFIQNFLSGMYVIKMFTWEEAFAKGIENARINELKAISKSSLVNAIIGSTFTFAVPISVFLSIYAVILQHTEITVLMVFVMIIFYSLLNYIVSFCFTIGLTKILEISFVLKKINEFMDNDEIEVEDRKNEGHTENACIKLDNIFASWSVCATEVETDKTFETTDFTEKTALLKASKNKGDRIDKPKIQREFQNVKDTSFLRNVSLRIEDGQLFGITGQVGSGKSSLLQVILGEILVLSGSKNISGTISYASQVPWIFTSTIRQNILFGLEYDMARYKEVVRVCGLENDLQQFPEQDLAIVGDGGVHLSNGLKKRLNLARAVYRKADIYLLDDPFSEVSIQMGNYLFDECVLGFLKNKCRVLVTFHMTQLKDADNLIYMHNGRIEKEGSYEDLRKSGLLSDDLRAIIGTSRKDHSIHETDLTSWEINKLYPDLSTDSVTDDSSSSFDKLLEKNKKCNNSKKERISSFKYLLESNKKCVFVFVILLFITAQIIISGTFYFLGAWTTAEESRNSFRFLSPLLLAFFNLRSEKYYENYFGLLVFILFVVSFAKSIFYSRLIKSDSKKIHDTALEKIITSDLRNFNAIKKIPIISIFSKGLNIIDNGLPEAIRESSQFILMGAGSFVLILLVNISFSLPVVILLLTFVAWVLIYSKCISDLARMENKLFSSMLDHLCIPSQGLITSRAMAAQRTLIKEFEDRQDNYSSFWFLHGTYSNALAFYVDLSCFLFFVYLTFVLLYQIDNLGISSGFIGVVFTQAIGLIGIVQYGIRQAIEVKIRLKTVEGISRYEKLKNEENPQLCVEPPSHWPDDGKIVFDNVCLRYDTDLPLVLKHISFNINPKEKVGIVGENYAGKSSIISAIFRLFIVDGCIEIDGFDTRDISPKLLRSKIAVIPQDPVLFAASLRYNLDPLGNYDDHTLYRAVQSLELEDALGEIYHLDYEVKNGGSNFSVGQRQLICLARALIGNKKILILDEGLPNLDPRMEALIQRIIRKKFKQCTVLTVSNRLSTLINSDKVIVLESGRVKEVDHPHLLLENPSGQFYNMISELSRSEAENLRKAAFENYIKWKI